MVAELNAYVIYVKYRCSLAKISMVAEHDLRHSHASMRCSLAKISMVAEPQNI